MLSGFRPIYLCQVKKKPKEINSKNKVKYKRRKKKPLYSNYSFIYNQIHVAS